MKSPARITQMIFVLEHLRFDCPVREAARVGGIRMLAWVLQDSDLAMLEESEARPPMIQ